MISVSVTSAVLGRWKVNAYLVRGGDDAWLIDPGDDCADPASALLVSRPKLKGILCTHGHFDHISGLAAVMSEFGARSYLHSKDLRLVNQVNLYRKLAGADTFVRVPAIDAELDGIRDLPLSEGAIRAVHAPGHTKGSMIFVVERCVFTGDLFHGGAIGRTDLPGGDKALIARTAEAVIAEFEGYDLYPGHGEPYRLDLASIDRIRKTFDAR